MFEEKHFVNSATLPYFMGLVFPDNTAAFGLMFTYNKKNNTIFYCMLLPNVVLVMFQVYLNLTKMDTTIINVSILKP